MVEDRIEKISYEGAIFGLKIHVGKTDYDKDKTYLKIALQVNQNKVLGKQVNLKQMGDYNEVNGLLNTKFRIMKNGNGNLMVMNLKALLKII